MTTILPISDPEPKLKTCATCTSLRGRRYLPEDWEKWQCFKSSSHINIVSGLKEYEKCAHLRLSRHGCDIEGKWYEEYIPPPLPEITDSISIGGKIATEVVFDEAALKANREAAEARIKSIKEKRGGW